MVGIYDCNLYLLQTYAKILILLLLRRKICRFQLLFLLWGDAVAFTGFLYGFAACPLFKCACGCNVRQRCIILLGKCCGKVPCLHHTHIVVLTASGCHLAKICRLEIRIKKVVHQHFNAKPYGVRGCACKPMVNVL